MSYRMRALLEQEETVEAEELFAEEADDQDFAVLKGALLSIASDMAYRIDRRE